MSVFDIFRSAPANGQPPQPGQPQGSNQMQTQPGQNPNGPQVTQLAGTVNQQPQANTNPTVPNATNTPERIPQPGEQPTGNESPMANFKDLFKVEPNQPNNEQQLFNLDPVKFGETVSKLDFSKSLNQADLAAITAGGEGAVAALVNVINKVGQESFAASARFSAKLTETGVTHTRDSFQKDIPQMIRKHQGADSLFQANPALRNPAAEPLVTAMQAQFSNQYPNATVSQVNEMVAEYFNTLPELFTKPKGPDPKPGSVAPNFAGFLDS